MNPLVDSEVMSFGTKQSRMVRGRTFWARGYCVSTVGLDEETIRAYIRNQEKNEVHRRFGRFGRDRMNAIPLKMVGRDRGQSRIFDRFAAPAASLTGRDPFPENKHGMARKCYVDRDPGQMGFTGEKDGGV